MSFSPVNFENANSIWERGPLTWEEASEIAQRRRKDLLTKIGKNINPKAMLARRTAFYVGSAFRVCDAMEQRNADWAYVEKQLVDLRYPEKAIELIKDGFIHREPTPEHWFKVSNAPQYDFLPRNIKDESTPDAEKALAAAFKAYEETLAEMVCLIQAATSLGKTAATLKYARDNVGSAIVVAVPTNANIDELVEHHSIEGVEVHAVRSFSGEAKTASGDKEKNCLLTHTASDGKTKTAAEIAGELGHSTLSLFCNPDKLDTGEILGLPENFTGCKHFGKCNATKNAFVRLDLTKPTIIVVSQALMEHARNWFKNMNIGHIIVDESPISWAKNGPTVDGYGRVFPKKRSDVPCIWAEDGKAADDLGLRALSPQLADMILERAENLPGGRYMELTPEMLPDECFEPATYNRHGKLREACAIKVAAINKFPTFYASPDKMSVAIAGAKATTAKHNYRYNKQVHKLVEAIINLREDKNGRHLLITKNANPAGVSRTTEPLLFLQQVAGVHRTWLSPETKLLCMSATLPEKNIMEMLFKRAGIDRKVEMLCDIKLELPDNYKTVVVYNSPTSLTQLTGNAAEDEDTGNPKKKPQLMYMEKTIRQLAKKHEERKSVLLCQGRVVPWLDQETKDCMGKPATYGSTTGLNIYRDFGLSITLGTTIPNVLGMELFAHNLRGYWVDYYSHELFSEPVRVHDGQLIPVLRHEDRLVTILLRNVMQDAITQEGPGRIFRGGKEGKIAYVFANYIPPYPNANVTFIEYEEFTSTETLKAGKLGVLRNSYGIIPPRVWAYHRNLFGVGWSSQRAAERDYEKHAAAAKEGLRAIKVKGTGVKHFPSRRGAEVYYDPARFPDDQSVLDKLNEIENNYCIKENLPFVPLQLG